MDEQSEPQVTFWSHLLQRKVFRVAVSYGVVSFVVIQLADATFDALAIPDPAIPWLLALMFFLFPFVVTAAWLFEITPAGIVHDRRFRRLSKPVEISSIVAVFGLSLALAAGFGYLGSRGDSAVSLSRGKVPTIAVLPFQNTGLEDAAFLGHGIADQLLTLLDKLTEFNIVGRTSSFYFGGQNMGLREIGKFLGADHILEGSIAKDGDRVLITAQLINLESLLHVWSETYDRNLGSVIDLELEIARSIASSMELTLSDPSTLALAETSDVVPDAYMLYLRGKDYMRRPASRETLQIAESLFEQALAIDPVFFDAEVSMCQVQLALYRVSEAPPAYQAAMSTCLKVASRPIASADANLALGDLNRLVGNFVEAETLYKKALNLDPKLPLAYHGLARSYQGQGRLALTQATFKAGIAVEPGYASSYRGFGYFLASQGRFSEAAEQLEKAVMLAPDDMNSRANLGLTYFDADNWSQALTTWEEALKIKRTLPLLTNLAMLAYYRQNYAQAIELLNEAAKIELPNYQIYGRLGASHRQLGNVDEARSAFLQASSMAEDVLMVRADNARLKATIASYYANLGDFVPAREYVDSALSIDPDNPDIHYYKALVLHLSGEDGVQQELERAASTGYPERLLNVDPMFASYRASAIVDEE